ncbi:tetratricopeptide repeat protein [Acinetobacter sp. MD2]|nr:tetratricopeptide repeat protein [Acinetobacter sp. MD2]MEB3767623.1 tetratricopeptide repeat protein [Acinetobacter sp. MD2]
MLGSMMLFAYPDSYAQKLSTPYNPEPLKQAMIAEFALQYQQPATALHNYTVLAIHTNSTAAKQRALDIALDENDLYAALDIASQWVTQDPTDVPALFYLAHITLKTHKYEMTAATLDKILNIDPDADLAEILAGIAPDDPKDRQILLNALRQSKARYNPSILVLIASLEAQNGELESALKNIQKALRKRPNVTSFILLKANLLEASNNQAATLEWYAKSSKKHRDNLEVHLAEAKYLIKIGQPEQALNKFEHIIRTWPNADEPIFIAGLTSIDLKHYDQAEQFLLQLKNSSQYQNDAYYYLAINAERKQHYETAKTYYRLVDGSLYTVSRRNLVNIYEKEDKLGDALRFLTQERVNYPQHASFLYQLQADILVKTAQKKAAVELLDEAIHNLPDDPDLIYAQVLLLDPYQDRERLDKDLNQLLNIEPNSPTYLNAYAYTLALQNRRLNDARKYVEHALEYAPDQSSILDTFGFIAFLQNDFKAAIPALTQAFEANHNINTGVRLAKALYLQGSTKRFNSLLQQLLHQFPNDPQVIQLKNLLLAAPHKTSLVHHATIH